MDIPLPVATTSSSRTGARPGRRRRRRRRERRERRAAGRASRRVREGEVDRAVHGGRLLLAALLAPVAAAVALIAPDLDGVRALTAAGGVVVGVQLLAAALPWHRLPLRASLLFPVASCAALLAVDACAPGVAAALTGWLVLCFAYVGLSHRPGSCLVLLPVAATTFVLVNGGWTRVTGVRLVLIATIWVLLAELLSRLAARQRDLAEQLLAAAHTDVLTGVGNRREVDLRLLRTEPGDVLVLCDLDLFKQVNDTHGHLVGDRVLADFGALLRSQLRAGDFAGRFGGEEFLLVLPVTTPAAALALLERLHTGWARTDPVTTFSAGLARCGPASSTEQTLAAADYALYAAKLAGRDTDRVAAGRFSGPVLR